MRNNQIHIRLDDDMLSKLYEYRADNNISTNNEAVNRILETILNEDTSDLDQKFENLERKIDECTKASYASLNILSFIYKDFCTLLVSKLGLKNKRFAYWSRKSVKDVFMFFRKAGNGCVALRKMNFWKNYKFATSEEYVRDGNCEELLGIDQTEFSHLVSGINDATAIRTKKLRN